MAAKSTNNLQELLKGAQLPALPQSAIRLLELSNNPDNGPADYAAPIEADPGLSPDVAARLKAAEAAYAAEVAKKSAAQQ